MALCAATALRSWSPDTSEPPPRTPLSLVSVGHPTMAASLAWMTTVQHFADGDAPAVEASARTAGELDPSWSAPWALGSMMLDSLDEPDRADALEHELKRRHPDAGPPHEETLRAFGLQP